MKQSIKIKTAILACVLVFCFLSKANAQVTISADTTSGCTPLSVNFQANAAGASAYIWDFGDGTTSVLQNPGRIYTVGGTYVVTVTITFPNQPPHVPSLTSPIQAFDQPIAGFKGLPRVVCKGELVQFMDTSDTGNSPITSRLWSFGDGTVDNQVNPIHSYSQKGFFNVSLVVQNAHGCNDQIFKNAYTRVNGPDASFRYDNTLACTAPLQVRFNQQSGSLVNFHFWDFGDGNTSTAQDPIHTYTTNGVFTVTHIVTDGFLCKDTVQFVDLVNIGQPNVQITANPSQICAGSPVTFSCGSNNALSVTWNFGPGLGTSGMCNPVKVFPNPGSYPVTFTMTDPNNCTLTGSKVITVLAPPTVSFFTPDTLVCAPPSVVNFTNTSIAPPGTFWVWDFGDGQFSTDENPTHTYTRPGGFSIKLKAIDPFGCMDSLTLFNYVNVGFLNIDLLVDTTAGCKPLDVDFNSFAFSNDSVTSYLWDFGDGTQSTLMDPLVHTYVDTGFYTIKLIVTNANGCVDSVFFRNYITVGDSVFANFSYMDTVFCGRDSGQFFNLSTGNYDKLIWNFGDGGSVINVQDPYYSFTDTGYQTVSLVASDRGCNDTIVKQNAVYVLPAISDFSGNLVGCDTPHQVNFLNLSKGGDIWHWDFGTGNPGDTSNVRTPTFSYTQIGSFPITLYALDTVTGCDYEKIKFVDVEPISAYYTQDSTSGCVPLTVNFTDQSSRAVTWVWNFGDMGGSPFSSPTHTFLGPGIFSPSLAVWNSLGCIDQYSGPPVWVMEPEINFRVLDTNLCAPDTISMLNITTSVAPLISWNWDFGNGTSSTVQYPDVIYSQAGHYTVSLTATDSAGCTATHDRPKYIYVQETTADFQIDFPANCIGNPVNFLNQSISQSPLDFMWDFGDDSTSTAAHPAHAYLKNGTFLVILSILDSIGCQHSDSQWVTIADPDISLLADTTQAPCPPLLVQFTGQANSIHTFSTWQWDLGNGVSSLQNPVNIYVEPGKYNVSVIGTTDAGCMDTVMIQDLIQIEGPSGDFSFSPNLGCQGLAVSFQSTTSQALCNQWDFGDGNLSPAAGLDTAFTHVYQQAGTFYPVMIIDDSMGCRRTIPSGDSVVIHANPLAYFLAIDTTGCAGLNVVFTDLSSTTNTIISWQWDFGDGQTGSGSGVSHIYTQPGIFGVQLIVTDAMGCTDTLVKSGYIQILNAIQPTSPDISYVTVHADNEIEIFWDRFPNLNVDFAQYVIHRKDPGGVFVPIFTSHDISQTSFEDKAILAHLNSYCYLVQVVNICGTASVMDESLAHCSILLSVTPAIASVNISWTPYVGWSQVDQYNVYRVRGYDSMSNVLIGNVPGFTTAFVDSSFECFEENVYRVEAKFLTKKSRSNIKKSGPLNVSGVTPVHLTRATVVENQFLQVEWDIPYVKKGEDFLLQKDDGSGYQEIYQQPYEDTVHSFQDFDVEVDKQPYRYRSFVQDSCGKLTPLGRDATSIFCTAEKDADQVTLTWTAYQTWQNGVENYEIEIFDDAVGNYTLVGRVSGATTTFVDTKSMLDQREYCYRIVALEGVGGTDTVSYSNKACLVVNPNQYDQNVFTPNGDGINDFFGAFPVFTEGYFLRIYSRWGSLVFESQDPTVGWDGTYNGSPVNEGVYYFVVQGMEEGEEVRIRGHLTLLR